VSVVRLLRLALAAALIALASGVPHAVLAALDDDECASPCDGDVGGKRCPPNCTQGACARSDLSAPIPLGIVELLRPDSMDLAPAGAVAPVLPLVTRGVFHPPRG
jgi:hypothetical protein